METQDFKCSKCGKTFLTKVDMTCHELKNHGHSNDITCTPINSDQMPIEHQTDRTRDFHCSKCDKSFFNKDYLRQHEHIHDGKTWKCQICNFWTTMKTYLLKHNRKHQSDRTRDFHCLKCDGSFFRKADLIRHNLKIHNLKCDK